MSSHFNPSTAIFLITDAVMGVSCLFEETGKPYTYKTFDKTLKVDDFVVVPSHGSHATWAMKIVKIVELNVDPDLDSSIDYKWIIGKVDRHDFEQIEKTEAEAITQIREAKKHARKKELQKELHDVAGDKIKGITFQADGADENKAEDEDEDSVAASQEDPVNARG